jgi:hypothetical protein
MTQLGQALTGKRKSTPKITRIDGDDNMKAVYKQAGNNHAYPFIWADTVTLASGTTEITIAESVKFHGYDLATYGTITATPLSNPGGYFWIDKNTTTNVVKLVCSNAAGAGGVNFDVHFMLGDDLDKTTLEAWACRGNTGAMPNFP